MKLDGRIIWNIKDGTNGKTYFSDERCEFVIHKEGDFYILSYTDFWTVSPNSFFVNIKKQGDEMFAVAELKQYAQKVFDEYKNRPEIAIEW
jgi:hypothetical protein